MKVRDIFQNDFNNVKIFRDGKQCGYITYNDGERENYNNFEMFLSKEEVLLAVLFDYIEKHGSIRSCKDILYDEENTEESIKNGFSELIRGAFDVDGIRFRVIGVSFNSIYDTKNTGIFGLKRKREKVGIHVELTVIPNVLAEELGLDKEKN